MEYAGKASSAIRNMFKLKKEEWKSDAWIAVLEIPAGMQGEICEKLSNMTAGRAEVKVIGREGTLKA
jgi:ribosome maturation protein SDO1